MTCLIGLALNSSIQFYLSYPTTTSPSPTNTSTLTRQSPSSLSNSANTPISTPSSSTSAHVPFSSRYTTPPVLAYSP